MQGHLQQALHNQSFTLDCETAFPDKYFDWKITATFYTAVHLLRAYCEKRKIDPGRTHHDIRSTFDLNFRKHIPKKSFPQHIWKIYYELQLLSENSRYAVFLDPELENEVEKDNYANAKIYLSQIKNYFATLGISCNIQDAA